MFHQTITPGKFKKIDTLTSFYVNIFERQLPFIPELWLMAIQLFVADLQECPVFTMTEAPKIGRG